VAKTAFYTREQPHRRLTSKFMEALVSLLSIILTLIVVGILLWLVNSYIPMDGKIKNILNVVVVIAVVLWLLQAFGVLGALNGVHVS
jgi:ABC-type long-subunit fatty acid transport system fused permease/ATPase subunit